MLLPTWILAIATVIVALSVPAAWFTWLNSRKQDREQQQRDRDAEARADTLKEASEKFVTKDAASAVAAVGFIVAMMGLFFYLDARKPES